jgi:hypothetical protein
MIELNLCHEYRYRNSFLDSGVFQRPHGCSLCAIGDQVIGTSSPILRKFAKVQCFSSFLLRKPISTAKGAKHAKGSQSNFREKPLRSVAIFALLAVIKLFRNKN